MTTYKIGGTTQHGADIHIIQDGSYFGSKAVGAGAYEVSFDSTTPSGIIAVAKKSDGEIAGYGDVIGVTASGTADLSAGGGASIKSIQTGTVTIGSGQSSNTATISSVDASKSMLIWGGNETASGPALFRYCFCYAELTDATTVTAVRQGSSGSMTVRYTVVEYESGVSVQRGVLANSQYSSSREETITEVDTSKAFCNFCGWNQSNESHENIPQVYLKDSTTVRMQLNNVNNFTQASYEVVEFD